MNQPHLRILTVAPAGEKRAPSLIEAGVVALPGGMVLVPAEMDAAGRAAVQRLFYSPPADRQPYNAIKKSAQVGVFRSRLLSMAGRPGATSLILAGRMLKSFGNDARRMLRLTYGPAFRVPFSKIDEALARAGVPARRMVQASMEVE